MKKAAQIKLAFSLLNTVKNVVKHISGINIFKKIEFWDCTKDEWEIIDGEIYFVDNGHGVGFNDQFSVVENIIIANFYNYYSNVTQFILLDTAKMTSEKEFFDQYMKDWDIEPK